MKSVALLLVLGMAAAATAAEPQAPLLPAQLVPADATVRPASAPWLGISVGRLDDALRAQLPDLPAGFGFVVTDVPAGSPAAKAGVRPYDVFWKFDDQWLVNEAQLLVLLQTRQPGDEVKLGLYRSGRPLSLSAMLAPAVEARVASAVSGEVPVKVLRPADRSAEIESPDGKAMLTSTEDGFAVRILSAAGEVIYNGPLKDADGASQVPANWRSRVGALERALEHSTQNTRIQRTRVLPVPAEN